MSSATERGPFTIPDRGVATVEVERRHSSTLSYDRFLRDYVAKNRPVVVEDAVTLWPALRKWDLDFFKTRLGDKLVHVSYEEKMTFAAFIDGVRASRPDAPGPYMYRTFIGPHLPELLPDVLPQNAYAFPRRLASPLMPKPWRRPDGYLKLLIGGVGGSFPVVHYDGENMHAAITEIHGEKKVLLYSPEDTQYLYPRPTLPNKTLIKDIDNVDPTRFPLFERATRHETVLRPGEMVFVPSRWWHTAKVLTPSISVCQNMVDASNWFGYVAEAGGSSEGQWRLPKLARRFQLTALGVLLDRLERRSTSSDMLPLENPPHNAKLAPLTSAEAQDPSRWPMHTWTVD